MSEVPTHEAHKPKPEINKFGYPREYFAAQVQFALKWAVISEGDAGKASISHTALAKRFSTSGNEGAELSRLLAAASDPSQFDQAVDSLFQAYTTIPESIYVPSGVQPADDHFFGCDYYPNSQMNDGKNTLKIHFLKRARGERSGLAQELKVDRQLDLKRIVTGAIELHPELDEVIGGSWLYNLTPYRESFPESFIETARRLVPTELADQYPDEVPLMSFNGDSLWGQFINRYGWVHQANYAHFEKAVQAATTLKELVDAFPMKPMQPKAAPSVFTYWDPTPD